MNTDLLAYLHDMFDQLNMTYHMLMEIVVSGFPTTAEMDSLEIKLQQFKAIQQTAHELMQQENRQQALSTYMAVSRLMLEIELELIVRKEQLSIHDECDHEQN